MRLYIMEGGRAHLPDRSHLTPDRNFGRPVTIPLLMFLVDHPKGLVLVDTGVDTETADDPLLDARPEQRVDHQLRVLGYQADQVKFVILTHLHHDHVGCAHLFPRATLVVRRAELRAAWWPEAYDGGYDFDSLLRIRGLSYLQLPEGEDCDLFGDGRVICIDTKGHTEGHQSVVLDLPNTGKVVLTGDAVQVEENYTDRVPPGLGWNSQLALQAIERFRRLEMHGGLLVFGHELALLDRLRIAPEWYD